MLDIYSNKLLDLRFGLDFPCTWSMFFSYFEYFLGLFGSFCLNLDEVLDIYKKDLQINLSSGLLEKTDWYNVEI